jgi:hypothetical protein
MTIEQDDKIARVLAAAKDWLLDRSPRDAAERELFAAVCRAFPEEVHTRERCPCGDRDCDECLSGVQAEAMIACLEGVSH